MNTFQNIFFKLFEKSKLDKTNILIFNFYFSLKLLKNFSTKDKFKFLQKHILNNKLLSISLKEKLLFIFYKSQSHYFNLNKLVFKYKIKKANYYENNHDLNYTLLNNLSKNILITIYDTNNDLNYIFRISDIINIINNSLCYMDNFYFSVNDIKNPFTNIPFSISTLYNIYFKLKDSSFIMPTFFHLYFLSNFNKEKFYKLNECLIKSYTLNNYVKNINNIEKISIIKEMLNEFKNGMFVIYNKEILNDDECLITIFGSCIKDYLFMNHSNNVLLIFEAKENLKNKMLLISTQNILSQLNINININNIKDIIENFIRPHWRTNNNNIPDSTNNTPNSTNNNLEISSVSNTNTSTNTHISTNINPEINNNTNRNISINRNKIYKFLTNILKTVKKYNNYLIINYPILINIISINIFLFRLYISYKFTKFLYLELFTNL